MRVYAHVLTPRNLSHVLVCPEAQLLLAQVGTLAN